ncbi:hypothetical protein Tco_1242900 [Tanacetum coccineum]
MLKTVNVGIKSLLNAVSITAALIDLNATQSKLVLLENFNENYSKCLGLIVEVTTASTKLLLLEEVTTSSGTHMVAAAKVPHAQNPVNYAYGRKIEQYIQMIDYAMWEVIENGATLLKTQMVEGVMTMMPITSAEDKDQRTNFVSTRWSGRFHSLLFHVPLDEIKVDKTLRFVEEHVEIMDREIKSLKRSTISLVKVRWNSKRGSEFTWEREDYMKSKYPQLFVERTDESAS